MAKPSDKDGKKTAGGKPAAADPRTRDEISPARQLSILVVDDDPVDRMTVLRALKGTKLNPQTTEAADIASAVELIRKNAFDVIMLDHVLPDGKSLDLLRKIRDAGIRIPVIITTGFGDEMLVADLLRTGAADYLPKDRINADTVSRVISHAVRVYKEEEDKRKKDTLLEAGAEAVMLLNTQTDRLSVIIGALGILGRALGADRLTVFEQTVNAATKQPAISHRFEWSRDSDDFKYNDPGLQDAAYKSLGLSRWHTVLSSGHALGGATRSLPAEEQPFFLARRVISLLAVPVLVEDRCWGFVLIEDHRIERTWTERDKTMLANVATAIGNTLVHRRADEVLRRNEERFRAIVESQTDCICRFLPNGIVTFVNEACCQYYGKKREEVIGRPFAPYVLAEDRQALLDQLTALSPQNPFLVSENRSTGSDGKVRWGRWTNRAVFNEQGQLIEIQGVGHDITERKLAEEALSRSEASLATALQMAHAGYWEYDVDSDTFTFNDNFYRIFRTTAQEVGGYTMRSAEYARRFCHPDDLHRVAEEIKASNETADPHYSRLLEHRILYANGETGFMNVRFFVVQDESGRTIRTYGVNQDITEHKKAQGRLRDLEAIISQSPAIAFLWRNVEGWPIEFVSDNISQFGYTAEEIIAGKPRVADIIHPDDLLRIEKETEEHLRQGRDAFVQEYRVRTRGGEIRWVEDRTRIVRDAAGAITHLQGVAWDITERRKIEAALKESREYLDKIINSISDPIFVKDSQHRFVLVNDAECALADRSREEMIGKTDYDFFPKEQVDVFWKHDEEVLTTGQENVSEETISDAYGRTYTISTKKTRYTDPSGRHHIVGVIRDITDRKRAEEEIRHSEEVWRAQYMGFPIPTFTWTLVGDELILTDFNNAGVLLTEGNIRKYAGYKVTEFHKDRPDIIADIRRCLSERSTFSRETDLQFRTANRMRRLNITFVFVPPNQVMVHTDDVTEQREAEKSIRDSEDRYRTLAEASPDMIFMCAPNGDIIYTNTLGAQQWNLRPDQVAGKKQEELFPPEIATRHTAAIRRVCETKQPLFSEVTEMLQESKVWIETRLVPILNGKGEATAVLGVSRDITHRRQMEDAVRESEANFRALAENALDGIIIMTGAEARLVYANKAAVGMSTYSEEELLKLTLWDIVLPELREDGWATFQRRLAGDILVPTRYETRAIRKDGSQFPVDVSIAKTIWRGRPAVMAIARDISLQKKLEEERTRLAANLLEVQEKERRDISSVLHDHLGQLLTLTRLELGSVEGGDAASQQSIRNAMARLDEMLGSVRRLAVALRPPIIDDLGIEVALETLTEDFTDGSSIHVSFTNVGPKPALTDATETCLYRVLQEALTNAAKHSESSQVNVQLKTCGNETCLEIQDNGIGFDQNDQQNQKGIGFIGMRERLSRCGGSLEIISEKNKGTRIRACVPARIQEDSP